MKKTIVSSVLILSIIIIGITSLAYAEERAFKSPSMMGDRGEKRELVKAKLDSVKLRVCEAKESSIKKRGESLQNLSENILDKFDKISQRVQKYYTEKVLPSGKSVSNYDTLVTDINTKKEAVNTALTKAKENEANFSCSGDDPKGEILGFRDNMKEVKAALKDYRTSIKNLIVAVRSVVGETEKENATPSGEESK